MHLDNIARNFKLFNPLLSSFVTLPRALTTTGTNWIFFCFPVFLSIFSGPDIFQSSLSLYFSVTLPSASTVTSGTMQVLSFLSIKTMSGLLAYYIATLYIDIPEEFYIIAFNSTFWSMLIPLILVFLAALSCFLLYSFCASCFSYSLSICCTLFPFSHTFYKED